MIKIWAKLHSDDRIKKSIMWQSDAKFSKAEFHNYIYEICARMDIPSPVILKSHINSFTEFNIAKFLASDFLETVNFEYMIIEDCTG